VLPRRGDRNLDLRERQELSIVNASVLATARQWRRVVLLD
jgi:hypothetical protein